jgi:hypothetical protein
LIIPFLDNAANKQALILALMQLLADKAHYIDNPEGSGHR